jgi:type I restriction enzyme S subunit
MNVPALRFKDDDGQEFPEWEEKRLGDIADLTSSKRVYLSDYVSEGIPFYRGKEISELKRNETPKDILYITTKAYNAFKVSYGVPQVNDILITAVGTLGNVYRIKDDSEFYFKDGNLIWLRDIKISSAFLEILFETNNEAIQKSSIGSSQRALTIVELKKLKFSVPSLPEQTKIANFLTAVDDKISLLTQKADLLSQYKKGLMQQIFSQELRFKDDDGQEFPEWEVKTIADIFHRNTHSSKSDFIVNDGIYIVVDMGSISRDARLLITKRANFSNDCLTTNDLVMAKDDIGGGNIIGRVVQIPENNKYICSDHVYKLTIKDGYTQYISYFYYVINSFKVNKSFRQKANGTAQIGISNKTVDDQILPIPTIQEQIKIANFLTAIDEKITNNQTQLDAVKQYKQGLLQQMFV